MVDWVHRTGVDWGWWGGSVTAGEGREIDVIARRKEMFELKQREA
jgi:hypothetical protein